ncbi:MAG: hypothetical protein GMKNLPBB_00367 [Myxococcota bacterium]|nr:hypothetical protein [Myxococcota bacterium]
MIPITRRHFLMWGLVFLLPLAASCKSCKSGEITPEQEIKNTLTQAINAARERDVSGVMEFIAETYRDVQGHSRKDVKQLLAGALLRFQNIAIVTKNVEVRMVDNNNADLSFEAYAFAGRETEIIPTSADKITFVTKVTREDDKWKIQSARWVRLGQQ